MLRPQVEAVPRRKSKEEGFTLVEVLVALALAAILSGILLNGASSARSRARAADERQKSTFILRSIVAEQWAAPFTEQPAVGVINGFAWQVRQRRVFSDPHGQYALIQIEARVSSAAGRLLGAVETRRIKTVPPT